MNWIRNLFGKSKKAPESGRMNFLVVLMNMVNNTRENEYSCDEVYSLIDEYVDMLHRGEDAEIIMPRIKQHLDMCPDCREDFEALLYVIEAQTA